QRRAPRGAHHQRMRLALAALALLPASASGSGFRAFEVTAWHERVTVSFHGHAGRGCENMGLCDLVGMQVLTATGVEGEGVGVLDVSPGHAEGGLHSSVHARVETTVRQARATCSDSTR